MVVRWHTKFSRLTKTEASKTVEKLPELYFYIQVLQVRLASSGVC
jgi:hypothetical protein